MEEIKGRAQENLGSVEMSDMEGGRPSERLRHLPPATSWCSWHGQPPGPEALSMHLKKKKKKIR